MAEHIGLFSDRVEFDAVYQNKRASVTLGIPGIFSVYNALGVIAAALALNIPLQKIADALRTAQSVKGRVEVVPTHRARTILSLSTIPIRPTALKIF